MSRLIVLMFNFQGCDWLSLFTSFEYGIDPLAFKSFNELPVLFICKVGGAYEI
jgi:hypothetical protein